MPELSTPPPFEPLKLVGATVDGRYRLTAHLATGGMGAVFRAEHVYMRKELALKVLRPDLSASADLVERFRREAEIAASLDHENIVRVTDFGRSPEGFLFLAMELLHGESLFDRLRVGGAMSPEDAVPILVQVCSALDAAHRRGVVHRDLKPENVFLVPTEAAPLAKILDFGIAKITDPTTRSETQAGMVVGTPEYLSPEQALGSAVDGRADIYAVGLMAWRMLAGHHPFKGEDARGLLMAQATRPVPPLTDVRPDLVARPGLVAAVARACAKSPAQRHPTAADLRRDLAAAIGTEPAVPAAAARTPAVQTQARGWLPRPGRFGDGPTHSLRPSPSLAVAMLRARLRLVGDRGRDWALRTARAALATASDAWELVRSHPWISGGSAATALAIAIPLAVAFHATTPASRARDLIAHGQHGAARAIVETALRRDPGDAELRVLLGRALHRAGQHFSGLEAYESAAEKNVRALDSEAFADLAGDLARERRLADRAARLLAQGGARAVPAVLGATTHGSAVARLRALDLVHDLGADARVDRVAGYGGLLGDPDCELRKAAAKRLGDIGDAAALPKLRELAQAQEQSRGFLGIKRSAPACGSAEALAAARRIEATARQP